MEAILACPHSFYTQNDWTGWQFRKNYDDCSQVLSQNCPEEVSSSSKRKERGDYLDVALLVPFLVKPFGEMSNLFLKWHTTNDYQILFLVTWKGRFLPVSFSKSAGRDKKGGNVAQPVLWKPFWLATQFYTQNDWTGWQFRKNYDDCSQVLSPKIVLRRWARVARERNAAIILMWHC